MRATRACPYCCEEIATEAVRCPHCRSRLSTLDPGAWRRDHPERRIAGVAAALSHALAVPVVLVRAAFIILTFVHFLGPIAYAILWALIPRTPGAPTGVEQAIHAAHDLTDHFWHGRPSAGPNGATPPSPPHATPPNGPVA